MPRKKRPTSQIRKKKPDVKYQSILVTKFINKVMQQGKKDLARRIVYDAFDLIEAELEKSPLDVFVQALENSKPQQEVRSRRVGGGSYQVPMPVHRDRAETLAMRWMISFAKSKRGDMAKNLAHQIVSAYNGEGEVLKKKEDVHRMAEANKAFAHFRW